MRLAELVARAHKQAKAKGFYDGEQRRPLEFHALIVSEIAEATEEVRKGSPPLYFSAESGKPIVVEKPEGELVELADAVIRIADYCGARGWDLERAVKMKLDYNDTRPYRHGGKCL